MKPVTTYRLQLRKELGFRDATAIVDWLAELGISHAYASPYLTAQPGSAHGYDLVDPTRLNPELGTVEDYAAWTRALAERGMGHVVDVVPNHMAATTRNKWWSDVLENGPSSPYADYFDVEWHPPKAALVDKVLLPVLGAQYGEVLEKGELRLERHDGAFCVRYWENCLPVNPRSVVPVLERAASGLAMPPSDPRRQELESIVTGLRHLPASHETDPARRAERQREKEVLKRRLAGACADAEIAAAVDREVERINGTPGDAHSFDDLDALLLDQNFRLAFWRVATEEINYRRFFDVNELAAVRMESDAVFQDAHALLLANVREGKIHGLRLDHIDGLYDPAAYLAKVRAEAGDVYLVVEKILSHASHIEQLPADWPVEGTTGYDFLASASAVLVDRRAEAAFTRAYQAFTGDTAAYAEHVLQSKRMILRSSLSSELHMLAFRLERIAMRDRRSRDFTLAMLRRAIAESIAAFPVYRTYVRPDGSREPMDQAIVTRAVRLARRRNPDMSPSVFDFLREVLLLEHADPDRVEFTMRFQQLTGPVTAKGVEDTAFYTYLRFVALNEVGGSPDRFGTTIADFHAQNAARREKWPRSMIAVATHDTKRGADVRARLAVLSEMPEQWEAWTREWLEMTKPYVRALDEEPAPSLADVWLFFQTAIGAYPLEGAGADYVERLAAYMLKAAREAKKHTSWLSPDETYEDALRGFVTSAMNDERFARSLAERAAHVATHGASNGLALVTLEAASPGVADTYQGGELWDLSLVDPDNRTPVDYARRRDLLRGIEGVRPRELLASFADGRVKLHVLRAAMRLRRERPELFLEGDYAPIDAGEEIVAFSRTHASGSLVCAVTRLPHAVTRGAAPWAVGDVWGDRVVAVPRGRWRDAFTGREHESSGALRASRLFEELPVVLLVSA